MESAQKELFGVLLTHIHAHQVQYYTELIQSKPNWTYIEGYIDEGISGTSTKKRDSFLRMIEDAKAGRFDFIITKEISRFSRSTLDSIKYTQELLEHDVGCCSKQYQRGDPSGRLLKIRRPLRGRFCPASFLLPL